MSSHCLTAPALSSRQSSALGPQERAPREVSVHLHAQWISGFPSPSLALVLVVSFSVGPAVCSPALPFLLYHLLAPDGGSVSSPRIYVLGHQKKGKQGHRRARPFPFSRPPRSAAQPSAYIALAVTWSHGYIEL